MCGVKFAPGNGDDLCNTLRDLSDGPDDGRVRRKTKLLVSSRGKAAPTRDQKSVSGKHRSSRGVSRSGSMGNFAWYAHFILEAI